jgi:hypothetical protein
MRTILLVVRLASKGFLPKVAKIAHYGVHAALIAAYAPMLPTRRVPVRFRAFLATAGRNSALLWSESRENCEDCPVWGQ